MTDGEISFERSNCDSKDVHKSKKSISTFSSNAVSAQQLSYQSTSASDVWSACNMYKQRVIEAKPTLLTPKSVSKLYGTLEPKPGKSKTFSKLVSAGKLLPAKLITTAEESVQNVAIQTSDSVSYDTDRLSSASDHSIAGNNKNLSEIHDTLLPPLSIQKLHNQQSWEENKPDAIQISPTIQFPVSRIKNGGFQPYHSQSPTLNFGASVSSLNDDVESLDQLSEISTYSYSSSVSYNQELCINSDSNSFQKTNAQDAEGYQYQLEDYQKETKDLRSALKLAEADTAILVSSKQQLQLDNHDLNETVKTLNNEISNLKQEITEKDVNIAILKRNNSTSETKSAELLQLAEHNLQSLQIRLEETNDKLDSVALENKQLKNKNDEIRRNFETAQATNKNLEEEVSQLMTKCAHLDSRLNETVDGSSDTSAYITSLREERDKYAVKLHSQEQDLIRKQHRISQLEERHNAVNEQHSALSVSYQTLLQVSKTKESAIASLQSQLAAKDKEKQALDGAIARLHENLFRVEASFTKMKNEMIQKTKASNQEMSIKQHFESQIVSLKDDLERVQCDCKLFTLKIGDKNNQISQLSEQLRRTLLSKRKCDSEIKSLKAEVLDKLKSLKVVEENEKKLLNTIQQKSRELSKKEEMLLLSTANMEELKLKFNKTQGMLDDSKTQLINKDKKLEMLKQNFETLQKSSVESANDLESKNNLINDLEREVQRCTSVNSTLNQQLENFKMTHEKNQQASNSTDDHLATVVSQLQSSRREISEQNGKLQREKKNLEEKLEKLKVEQKTSDASLNELMNKNRKMENLIESLKENLTKTAAHLEESKKNEQGSSKKLSQVNEEFSLLKDRLAATKYSLTQSKIDLKSKIKELSALSQSNATLNEELETAKKEMNAANMKVVELINSNQENNNDQEKLEMYERLQTSEVERAKLNEAVLQQQRYISSLQTHYQKWVNDAAVKFEELQARQFQQSLKTTRDVGSQTSHEEKPLPSSPFSTIATAPLSFTNDSSTQTYHDQKPLSPSLGEKAAKTQSICSSCGKLVLNKLQGDIPSSKSIITSLEAEPICNTIAGARTDTLTQSVTKYVQTSEAYSESRLSTISSSVACQTFVESKAEIKSISQTHEGIFSSALKQCQSVASQTDDVTNVAYFTRSVHCDASTETAVGVTTSSHQLGKVESSNLVENATQTSPLEIGTMHGATQTETFSADKSSQKAVSLQSSVAQTENVFPTLTNSSVQTIKDFNKMSQEEALAQNPACTSEKHVQTESEVAATDSSLKSVRHSLTQTVQSACADVYTQTAPVGNLPDIVLPGSSPACARVDAASQTSLREKHWDLSCTSPKLVTIFPVSTKNATSQMEFTVNDTACQTDFKRHLDDSIFTFSHNASSLTTSIQEGINILPVQTKNAFCQVGNDSKFVANEANFKVGYDISASIPLQNGSSKSANSFPVQTKHTFSQAEIDCRSASSQTEFDRGLTEAAPQSSQFTACQSIGNPDILPALTDSALLSRQVQYNDATNQTRLEERFSDASNSSLSFSVPKVVSISPVSTRDELTQTEVVLVNVEVQTGKINAKSVGNVETQTEFLVKTSFEPGLSRPVRPEQVSETSQTDETLCGRPKSSSYLDISTQTTRITVKSVTCSTDAESSKAIEPDASKNFGTQTTEKLVQESFRCPDENLCSHCGRSILSSKQEAIENFTQTESNPISLPQFPNTSDFLNQINTEDKAKLKAYKQTVKVLRNKLKQAEKQLASSRESCNSLQLELEALKSASIAEKVMLDRAICDKRASNDLERELDQWKESTQERDALIESLQNEILQVKKYHGAEKEKMRRKSKAEKLIKEKKMKEVNERLKMLVDANERLRKNVDKLQIKLTASNKQLEASQREKLRYQQRARKLQADLRSLSWIASSSPEQNTGENAVSESHKEQVLSFELPAAVREIDCILKDLKKEIGVLEEQLHHHSSAVRHSNTSLKELYGQDNVSLCCGDGFEPGNSEADLPLLDT